MNKRNNYAGKLASYILLKERWVRVGSRYRGEGGEEHINIKTSPAKQ